MAALPQQWQHCHMMTSLPQLLHHCHIDDSTATTIAALPPMMAALPLTMAALPHRWQNRHIDGNAVILMKVQICDDGTSTR
jgi:hypothetical protein